MRQLLIPVCPGLCSIFGLCVFSLGLGVAVVCLPVLRYVCRLYIFFLPFVARVFEYISLDSMSYYTAVRGEKKRAVYALCVSHRPPILLLSVSVDIVWSEGATLPPSWNLEDWLESRSLAIVGYSEQERRTQILMECTGYPPFFFHNQHSV